MLKVFIAIGIVLLVLAAIVIWAFIVPPGQNLKEMPAFLDEHKTDIVELDGVRLHYLKKGAGSPVILLHGGGTWLYSYRHNLDALAQEHTVYVLDMPGHGFTKYDNPVALSLTGFSGVISKFMQSQDIVNADIVGSSWGGGWALHFAETHPEKVRRLVLIDSTGTKEIARHDKSAWRYLSYPVLGEALVHFFTRRSVEKDLREKVFYDESRLSDADIKQIYIPLTFTANLRAQYILQRSSNWKEVESGLGRLPHRTLVIWGSEDNYIAMQDGQRLSRLIPNAQFIEIKNAGHLPHEERPEEVNRIIRDFLL